MSSDDLNVQNLRKPDIEKPTKANRQSFIRGWNEAVNNEALGTAEAGEDNWRTAGWQAGNTFGDQANEFRYKLFLWTINQRRLALGLSVLGKLTDE